MPDTAAAPRPKLTAALDLASAGFRVFPLEDNGKRPAFQNWQSLATTDKHQIEKWWGTGYPANIGVITDRLLVIDIDPRKGGAETFAGLSLTEHFPDTPVAKTQGGGSHIIYALPDGVSVRGGADRLGQGVDVKSRGGYICGVGSTIDNRPYEWQPGFDPKSRPIAPAPQWLIDRCNAARTRTRSSGERIIEEDETALEQAEAWLAQHAPEAAEGERDNTAFKVAARLYDFGVSQHTCECLLAEWNEAYCQPPLDHDAISRLAWSAQRNRDNAIGAKHPGAPGFEPQQIDETKAPTPAPVPTKRPRIYALPYAQASEAALTDVTDPLIEGLLDRKAMSVWYGESNSGKTFVMLDAAWHIAAGRQWAGRQTRKGPVAYVAAEGGRGILKRIRALQLRHPDAGEVALYTIPCPVDLLHKDADLKPLVAEIRGLEAASGQSFELVVIDTLSRAIAGGNENDSQDMGALVAHLDLLRAATGAHVAVVHHTGKDKAKGARGHSLLRAATDTEIEIDERTLTVTKQRDMDGNLSLPFALRHASVGVSAAGRTLTSCTVEWGRPGDDGEPMPLSPRLEEFLEQIEAAIEERKRDKRDTSNVFGWEFAGQCLAEIYFRHSSGKDVKRQTVQDMLTEMTEKCRIKKVGRNQWVTRDAGFAGNAGNMLD